MIVALLTRAAGLCLCALLLSGCGRRPAPPQPPAPAPGTSEAPMRQELSEPAIRMVDPEGRWTFELKAERATAAGLHGPYEMEQVTGVYHETGRPDVLLSADTARVDETSRRVALQGHASITSAAWQLQADRVDYNLDSGEVVATGQTKWTFTESPVAPEQSRQSP